MSEKLKLGAKTAIDIEKLRDGYRPAAKRGAILFFVLAEMSLVNTMYQYSLASYLEVFQLSLKKSMPDSILQKRLRNIMDTLTHNIYNYGCTGALAGLHVHTVAGRTDDEVVVVVVRESDWPQVESEERLSFSGERGGAAQPCHVETGVGVLPNPVM